jgi:hypothetical protein
LKVDSSAIYERLTASALNLQHILSWLSGK